jgi:hypothetical protein
MCRITNVGKTFPNQMQEDGCQRLKSSLPRLADITHPSLSSHPRTNGRSHRSQTNSLQYNTRESSRLGTPADNAQICGILCLLKSSLLRLMAKKKSRRCLPVCSLWYVNKQGDGGTNNRLSYLKEPCRVELIKQIGVVISSESIFFALLEMTRREREK